MSDDKQYISGTAKLEGPFELKYTKAGKGIATAKAEFNDVPGMRYGDLAIWEPEQWFDTELWWQRMEQGSTVGFRGSIKERSWTGQDGKQKTRKEVTVYAIAPLWERPKRG